MPGSGSQQPTPGRLLPGARQAGRGRTTALRALAVAAVALAWIGVFTHVARANTVVIGEATLTSSGSTGTIGAGANVPVFQGDATANDTLTSPVTGTITKWSFLSAGAANGAPSSCASCARRI